MHDSRGRVQLHSFFQGGTLVLYKILISLCFWYGETSRAKTKVLLL